MADDPLDAPPLERRGGTVQGRPAAWWVCGPEDGVPVLLLHGSGVDEARLSWGRIAGPLARAGCRVIAPDLPGYGGTRGFGRAAGVAEMTGWVRAFREVAGVPPATVAGASMGGAIALSLALEAPEAVTALVPVGTYGVLPRMPRHALRRLAVPVAGIGPVFRACASSGFAARRFLVRLYKRPERIDAPTLAAFRAACLRQCDTPAIGGFLHREVGKAAFRTALAPRLGEIAVPIAFVHGDADPYIPLAGIEAAAAPHEHARVVALDAGHWPSREVPDRVVAALLDTIRQRVAA
ncbi:MAG: alpha/beta fold hydrolase [Hasllibacter sp.]